MMAQSIERAWLIEKAHHEIDVNYFKEAVNFGLLPVNCFWLLGAGRFRATRLSH
jgi:hypothetical protein